MMKHTRSFNQANATIKPSNLHKVLQLKRANSQAVQGPLAKRLSVQRYAKRAVTPTLVIHRQEMESFFRLFDDSVIRDFLWKDGCCKMADKYLLAMTFVYFKRASFTCAEYTRRNFFLALYLANTMEEDEEEIKYDIFPWALGKSWRKRFATFLKQKDKLWARIEYRAAVSRHCCEEVMAIVSSHFVWQRERLVHHSGALRHYSDQRPNPSGPFAPAVSCALCHRGTTLEQGPEFPSTTEGSSGETPHTFSHLFTSALSLEFTPPRAAPCNREEVENQRQKQLSFCCCADEVPGDESFCGSSYDTSMDWICKE